MSFLRYGRFGQKQKNTNDYNRVPTSFVGSLTIQKGSYGFRRTPNNNNNNNNNNNTNEYKHHQTWCSEKHMGQDEPQQILLRSDYSGRYNN